MQTSTQMNSSKKLILIIVFGLVAGAGIILGLGKFGTLGQKPLSEEDLPPELQANYLPQGRPLAGIDMLDQDGKPFNEARLKNHWSFMFFGFTNCPDVCPTTLLVMQQVWKKLPAEAMGVPSPQLIFVSVDPDRDTQEKLKAYVAYYHPEFIGIRSDHNKLDVLVKQVGALYGYEDGTDSKNYTVNHSAHLLLIDPQGNVRAVFAPPFVPDELTKTFISIRNFHKG